MIVNGQQQTQLPIADRAIQYGDGCFTTMVFKEGHIEFFDAHIERLKLACSRLSIQFNKWQELKSHALASAKNGGEPFTESVIKIIISRGLGGRGYSTLGVGEPNYFITLHPIPLHYRDWQIQGISLTVSAIQLAKQPLLAGIKHLNRLEQVLVKQDIQQLNVDDAIVCDTDQHVIETSVGNVFWRRDNQWFTAELSGSGVEGVMRNQILEKMKVLGTNSHVVKQKVADLMEAEEMFVCNSLMRIVPINELHDPDTARTTCYKNRQVKVLQKTLEPVIEKYRKAF